MSDSNRSNAQQFTPPQPERPPTSSRPPNPNPNPNPNPGQASASHHIPSQSHSRKASSSSSRLRSPTPPSRTPTPVHDETQDVLTAGDGLASHLGVDPSSSQAHARRGSSPSAKPHANLSGPSAHGGSGASGGQAGEGLTGFDSAKGYQDSGSGGVFTASGGLEPVPHNAPALMYSGGAKGC